MNAMALILDIVLICVMPIVSLGLINRTKAIWAGRKGPRIIQFWFDLQRLCRKKSVFSSTATELIWMGPAVVLATTVFSTLLTPLIPGVALIRFEGSVIYFIYLLGLGRLALVIASLDTGSAFEGMGASREVSFSAFIEPAFILCLGLLASLSPTLDLLDVLDPANLSLLSWSARLCISLALLIWILFDSSRVPVDDPNTHLELTMIHEVMILDHSGPDLAALQLAAGLKLVTLSAILSAVLYPFIDGNLLLRFSWYLAFQLTLAVVIGTTESIMARFRMKTNPYFAVASGLCALLALLIYSGGLL